MFYAYQSPGTNFYPLDPTKFTYIHVVFYDIYLFTINGPKIIVLL